MWGRLPLLVCMLAIGCRRGSEATPTGSRLDTPPVVAECSVGHAKDDASGGFPTLLAAAQARVGEERHKEIEAVFREWARTDLAAARRAAGKLTDKADWFTAHEVLLEAALAHDVREAIEWVLALKPAERSAVLLDPALSAWVKLDADAAGAHVAGLAASDYRTVLSGELAGAWAKQDPSAAVAWSGALTDQEAREEALKVALARVVEVDPRRAADLALVLPREGDRAMALERIVGVWWANNPEAVQAWQAQLADATIRVQVERLLAAQREAHDGGARMGVAPRPPVE